MASIVSIADGAGTVAVAHALASLTIVVGALVLLYYLYTYVRVVLAEPYRHRWWYMAVGVAAGGVYGAAGLLDLLLSARWLGLFTEGATLFFILFLALGLRTLYHFGPGARDGDPGPPRWVDYLVIGVFVLAWWAGFLTSRPDWVGVVEAVGWVGATLWAIGYGVLVVRGQEGTSVAALVRHLLPAVFCFSLIVFAGLAGRYLPGSTALAAGTRIVGTVLVGAFLFNAAVALRQQSGEVSRYYDPTTWRE
ncbi:MAG: hypothetical protein ABEI39_00935 [Halobacteriales archaeon]